jgi:formylglycine-generating enzyme required for sulfatase activity
MAFDLPAPMVASQSRVSGIFGLSPYCRRYRPAARFPEPVDTSTCHVGFRCIVRSGHEG